jgi:hypothetical protein
LYQHLVHYSLLYGIYNPECPHCNQFSDTFIHQLQCESEISKAWRKQFSLDLESRLRSWKTRPNLHLLIVKNLPDIFFQREPAALPADRTLAQLIDAQSQIGWQGILYGMYTTHWSKLQDNYLHSVHERSNTSTGNLWTIPVDCFPYSLGKPQPSCPRHRPRHRRSLSYENLDPKNPIPPYAKTSLYARFRRPLHEKTHSIPIQSHLHSATELVESVRTTYPR